MLYFWAAAFLSSAWFLVHIFIGGREIAAPLRDSRALPMVVRETQYLCWHFTSAAIAFMAVAFALAAVSGIAAYAVAATLLSAAFSVTGVGLVALRGKSFRILPQGWLFVPVAGFGICGLIL